MLPPKKQIYFHNIVGADSISALSFSGAYGMLPYGTHIANIKNGGSKPPPYDTLFLCV